MKYARQAVIPVAAVNAPQSSPAEQILWAILYIKDRYGGTAQSEIQ